jgi:hypothetical protein
MSSVSVDRDEEEVDKWVNEINLLLTTYSITSRNHAEILEQLLRKNPEEGIKLIGSAYHSAVEEAYADKKHGIDAGYMLALVGGPSEHVSWPIYNAVGAVYPNLSRDYKDAALKQLLQIFDGLNYGIVNGLRGVGHTTGIREPLLVADISIAEWRYWPGLDDVGPLVKKFDYFEQFHDELIDMNNGLFRTDRVDSDFLVAYAALRKDYTKYGGRYVEFLEVENPAFLDRVMRAIVGIRFGALVDETQQGTEKGTRRLKKLLPESLHEKIEPLRLEGGWVDRKKLGRRS